MPIRDALLRCATEAEHITLTDDIVAHLNAVSTELTIAGAPRGRWLESVLSEGGVALTPKTRQWARLLLEFIDAEQERCDAGAAADGDGDPVGKRARY